MGALLKRLFNCVDKYKFKTIFGVRIDLGYERVEYYILHIKERKNTVKN